MLHVNEGHALRRSLVEAARLQQMHFASVTVLEGGLRAWQLAGGAVEGEAPDSPKWATLSPSNSTTPKPNPTGWSWP